MLQLGKSVLLLESIKRIFWKRTGFEKFPSPHYADCDSLGRAQPLNQALNSTRHIAIHDLSPPSSRSSVRGHQFFEMLDDGPALLVVAPDADISPCDEAFRNAGLETSRCRSLKDAKVLASSPTRRFSLFVIDIDSLGGIAAAIDGVLALRDARPCTPLILVSAEVAASDFSTERLRLCDVTLRAPASYCALELAIVEAARNNLEWCGRDDA